VARLLGAGRIVAAGRNDEVLREIRELSGESVYSPSCGARSRISSGVSDRLTGDSEKA